jgi:hypothetical protein
VVKIKGFFFRHRVPASPTQLPIQWERGTISLGVKRSECEADHSLSSSTEVRNAWCHTSTPQYVFMAWYLVKHRDKFYIYFVLLSKKFIKIFQVNIIIDNFFCIITNFEATDKVDSSFTQIERSTAV